MFTNDASHAGSWAGRAFSLYGIATISVVSDVVKKGLNWTNLVSVYSSFARRTSKARASSSRPASLSARATPSWESEVVDTNNDIDDDDDYNGNNLNVDVEDSEKVNQSFEN